MSQNLFEKYEFAALVPSVGVFGGVRRFIEIGNELIRRGHRYVLYHPTGERPVWLPFHGEVQPLSAFSATDHQVLICNDPPLFGKFENAQVPLKLFYFALENIRGERAIARNENWTILANSTGLFNRLHRKYRVTAEKVIGGINPGTFHPASPSGDGGVNYRVMAFGRLSRKKKGVPIVLRAVEAFAKSVARSRSADSQRPVKLVLFDHLGPGNERDPRDEIPKSFPHEFHLNLSQKDLAKLYVSCDVFVSAEKRAGWANTVAEAMACGLPVVCTRAGTLDIATHKETAWVAPWRHRFFLQKGLRAVHADPGLADRMSQNALAHIRRFSWPHVVDQLEDVVRRRLSSLAGRAG